MIYHAKVSYNKDEYIVWSNKSKQTIIDFVLVPFVNGQIVYLTNSDNGHKIFNMKNATTLQIYKTNNKVLKTEGKSVRSIIMDSEFNQYDCSKEITEEYKNTNKQPEKSELERKFSEVLNQVFVIMKFGDETLDSAYDGVIAPVVREFDLTPVRVDRIHDSGIISNQIIESIAKSKYILADLTGERPNTYYEAGFAHALGKEMIFTIKSGNKIHFDLSGHRFIEWTTENNLRIQLRERFSSIFTPNNQ